MTIGKTIGLRACDAKTSFSLRRILAPPYEVFKLRRCIDHRDNDAVCPRIKQALDLLGIMRGHSRQAGNSRSLGGSD